MFVVSIFENPAYPYPCNRLLFSKTSSVSQINLTLLIYAFTALALSSCTALIIRLWSNRDNVCEEFLYVFCLLEKKSFPLPKIYP